jgi:hypothetical protein
MRKLGVTQRKLLWAIARRPGWTVAGNRVGRDRTTIAAVLDTLLRRGLVETSGEGWQISPTGALCLLALWPAHTNPAFGAALRAYLASRAQDAPPGIPAGCEPDGVPAPEVECARLPELRP